MDTLLYVATLKKNNYLDVTVSCVSCWYDPVGHSAMTSTHMCHIMAHVPYISCFASDVVDRWRKADESRFGTTRVKVAGIVVDIDKCLGRFVRFSVDDGTAVAPCILWLQVRPQFGLSSRDCDVRIFLIL